MGKLVNRRLALKAGGSGAILAAAAACGDNPRPSTETDLAELDAVSTAQAVKNGEVSASEVIDAAIVRSEAVNPKLNAIVTPYYDSARDRAAGAGEGPWFGVPTFIKDLNNVIGQRTTFGSRAFQEYVAAAQSDLVTEMFGKGMISLGKSASPEFGLNATTETALSGDTKNPWDLSRSSGGSSGGAAALVAARAVPVAHASDGGGSIRIPAACCGVVGLKPSRFRIPEPERPAGRSLRITEHGIEARSVRDVAAFFAMLEIESDHPPIGFVDGPGTKPLRIAFHTDTPTRTPVNAEVVQAVRDTATALADAGHTVEEISAPFPSSVAQDFGVYWASGATRAVANWESAVGRKAGYGDFEPWTFGLIESFRMRETTLPDVVGRLTTFERVWNAAFDDFDLLISPVLAEPAAPLGYLSPMAAFPDVMERISAYSPFTHFANIAGAPAISLPLAQSSDSLPIGVMIAAAQGNEKTILEASYLLEELMPWKDRRPLVTA